MSKSILLTNAQYDFLIATLDDLRDGRKWESDESKQLDELMQLIEALELKEDNK